MIDETRFLEDLTGRFAAPYVSALSALMVAKVRGTPLQQDAALAALNDTMRETLGISELLGASLTLQSAAPVLVEEGIALRADRPCLINFAAEQVILPRVTLAEAGEELIARAPVTIRNAAERTWQRISQLYGKGRVMAFVRSAEQSVTQRARILIREALEEGIGEGTAGRAIKMGVDEVRRRTAEWTESYARMAFRTNLNTAVTAGRFRQVQDPDVRAVIPAFRFQTAGDTDVRSNHGAANGLIFSVTNPVWGRIAPPLGFSCRCRVVFMTRPALRRMGRLDKAGNVKDSRLPRAAHPDPGFRHGGRPDLFLGAA